MVTGTSERRPGQVVKQKLAALWWLPMVRGVLLLIFGLMMFVRPGATLATLIQITGSYWLLGGIADLVEAITSHQDRSRRWMILSGVISVLAGITIIGEPILAGLVTTTLFSTLVGLAVIAAGGMQLLAARDGGWSWSEITLGLLYALFGIILTLNPLLPMAVLLILLPIWAIGTGGFIIATALQLRGLAGEPS